MAMETFEIHITGLESIHELSKRIGKKTITVEMVNKAKLMLYQEHMTSMVEKYDSAAECIDYVERYVRYYGNHIISRAKVECPAIPEYSHYLETARYVEAHFEAQDLSYPMSRNASKNFYLATDREYDKSKFNDFIEKYKDKAEIEICVYDTNIWTDNIWFAQWPDTAVHKSATDFHTKFMREYLDSFMEFKK